MAKHQSKRNMSLIVFFCSLPDFVFFLHAVEENQHGGGSLMLREAFQ